MPLHDPAGKAGASDAFEGARDAELPWRLARKSRVGSVGGLTLECRVQECSAENLTKRARSSHRTGRRGKAPASPNLCMPTDLHRAAASP